MALPLAAFGSDRWITVGNIKVGPLENPGIGEVDDRPRSRFHAIYFGFSTHNGFDEEKGTTEDRKEARASHKSSFFIAISENLWE